MNSKPKYFYSCIKEDIWRTASSTRYPCAIPNLTKLSMLEKLLVSPNVNIVQHLGVTKLRVCWRNGYFHQSTYIFTSYLHKLPSNDSKMLLNVNKSYVMFPKPWVYLFRNRLPHSTGYVVVKTPQTWIHKSASFSCSLKPPYLPVKSMSLFVYCRRTLSNRLLRKGFLWKTS